MAKVITAATQAEEKMKNGLTRVAKVYKGSKEQNLESKAPEVFASDSANKGRYKVGSNKWENSEGYVKLWNEIHELQGKIKNAAGSPSAATLATLVEKLYIDVQRNADELLDLTPLIATVVNRDDLQEITYLRDILPYIGKEKVISGANDTVPLIDQKLANTETVTQEIKGFGWKDSVKNLAFNSLHNLQRLMRAVAIISIDYKNNDLMSVITAATFGAKHAQTADAAGSTFDLKVYNTLRKAYKTLAALYHPMYTKKLVADLPQFANQVSLLINPADEWDIMRIASGFTAGGFVQDVRALPIKNIIPYGGGIMDGEVYGKETLSLPGVTQGTAYMYIPGQAFVLNKRDTTMEVGSGSVLELSTEERAWYRISGKHTGYLLGGAASNTGKGCIIKITLPTE